MAKPKKSDAALYQCLILSDELENRLTDVTQFLIHRAKWAEWGLDKIREQGVAILFVGEPGLGKTMTAQWYRGSSFTFGGC